MTSYEIILDKIKQFIIENCEKKVLSVEEDKPLSEYILNSIDYIKVIVEVEEYFEIEFTNDDLEISQYTKVSDLVSFIEQKVNGV